MIISKDVLEDMRSWIADCEWQDLDDLDIEKLTTKEIIRGINTHFDGGVDAFMATY